MRIREIKKRDTKTLQCDITTPTENFYVYPSGDEKKGLLIHNSPAVFVWTSFPGLGGPGISTKGLFAKNPKAAYNHEMINQYFGHAPDLAKKLRAMLDQIPALGIPEGQIWQGDFLYDKDSVHTKVIDGTDYYVFHPNTLVYTVPVNSEIGARVAESEIGVVWHTIYTGDSLENATPSFSAKAEKLNYVPAVFSTDPYVKSIAGEVTLTAEETAAMDKKLTEAEALAHQLTSHPRYEVVVNDEAFVSSFFTVFQNDTIRRGQKVPNPETFIADFMSWAVSKVRNKAEKSIAGLKTEKGRTAARQKMEQELQTVQEVIEDNEDVLILIIELIGLFTDIKETFTRKMDALGKFQTYLQMKSGEFRRTGQEGFAVSDISGNVVKFIDRTEFSFANFSADVEKGWNSDRRVQESSKLLNSLLTKIDRLLERGSTVTSSDAFQEILRQLQDLEKSGRVTKRQLNTLLHYVDDIFPQIDVEAVSASMKKGIKGDAREAELLLQTQKKAPFLNHLIRNMGKFQSALLPMMMRAWRAVHTDTIQAFIDILEASPIITPEDIERAHGRPLRWQSITQRRLSQSMDQEDVALIIEALNNTYRVTKSGNSGMGDGETLYSILTNSTKPNKGDIAVPGFGELEVKGKSGRLKGTAFPVTPIKDVTQQLVLEMPKQFPEIIPIMKKYNVEKIGFHIGADENRTSLFPDLNEALGSTKRRQTFYHSLWYGLLGKHFSKAQSLINSPSILTEALDVAVAASVEGDFTTAVLALAGTEFELYRISDGFDAMLVINEVGQFTLVQSYKDIIQYGIPGENAKAAAKVGRFIGIKFGSATDNVGDVTGISLLPVDVAN